MISFEHQRTAELARVYELDPGYEALVQLKNVRENYDCAISGYMNLLKITQDTMYEGRFHFLLELLQNADDAQFNNGEAKLKFLINNDNIELIYNEKGFNIQDVVAITDTGESTKINRKTSAHSFIGEKGVGFKSVFALASEVEIDSYPWHFVLKKEKCIVPEPLHNSALGKNGGTRICIRFTEAESISKVYDVLSSMIDPNGIESFLFLQRLTSLEVEDRRTDSTTVNGIYLVPENRKGDLLRIHFLNNDTFYEYALYHKTVQFAARLVKKRWEKIDTDGKALERRLSVAALVENPEKDLPAGRLFCYLPTKVILPIPIYLQIDGHLIASRESLNDPKENEWNRHLLSLLPDFLCEAILNWRYHSIVKKRLPDYIPVDAEDDQLSEVFESVIEKLQDLQWVRTYENNWVSPQEAILADDFWFQIFHYCDNVRVLAEEVLERKFIHPDWAQNENWKSVWETYDVEKIDIYETVKILSKVELPESCLRNDEMFVTLYSHLSSCLGKKGVESHPRIKAAKHQLRNAAIFPIEGNMFGALMRSDVLSDKVYYISGQSKREVGIDSNLVDFKIVNPEYTYQAKASTDSSQSRQQEVQRINDRNKAVRSLLEVLGIKEVNDETLLTIIQIPALLDEARKTDDTNGGFRIKILAAIFEAYRAKNAKDPDYLKEIAKIRAVMFPSISGDLEKLALMILPPELRMSPEDELYVTSGLKVFKIPGQYEAAIKEKPSKSRETWRQFLIECGICNKPSFTYYYRNFDNRDAFMRSDKERFDAWNKAICGQVTHNREIKIIFNKLDGATITLLHNIESHIALSEQIYRAWVENVTTGNMRVEYYYYGKKDKRLEDPMWGGITRNQVPLRTLSDTVTFPHLARRVQKEIINKSSQLQYCIPLICETQSTDELYHKDYLDSLHVKSLTIADINALWRTQNLEDSTWRKTMITIVLDFLSMDLPYEGLVLYDCEGKRLRSADSFGLGKSSLSGKPLIELQYGELGTKLGKLIGLPLEDEANEYIDLFRKMADSKSYYRSSVLEKIKNLLVTWRGFEYDSRLKIQDGFQKAFGVNRPFLLLNKFDLSNPLSQAGYKVINLEVTSKELRIFSAAAHEIGFLQIDKAGELRFHNEMPLNTDDALYFDYLIDQYFQEFDETDLEELNEKCDRVGLGPEYDKWSLLIHIVENGSQIIGQNKKAVEIPIVLPVFTEMGFFMACADWSTEEIVAQLIAKVGLERIKIARKQVKCYSRGYKIQSDPSDGREKPKRSRDETNSHTQSGIDDNNDPSKPSSESDAANTIKKRIWEDLKDDRDAAKTESDPMWRSFIDPEQEEAVRRELEKNIKCSLEQGPESYERKFRKTLNAKHDGKKWVDPRHVEPRQFFSTEYEGRCQICATQLTLANGTKLINTYHIDESNDWWKDKPFNLLGLCPNCHALAKHGGGLDLTAIPTLVKDWVAGNVAPEEMCEYAGDYYGVLVKFNGQRQRIVLSSNHLSWFSALFNSGKYESGE